MRRNLVFATGQMLLAFSAEVQAQKTIADVLTDPAFNLNRQADRAHAVEGIRAIENLLSI